jgi:crotonobetainyl-CoA:carnitine CoA-transferase CaiB-like acyl-CoA transferase
VVDANLLTSMFQLMGPLPSAYAHMGYLQPRLGSGIPYTVPRGTYRCADGVWIAISSSSDSVANRVLALLGLRDDPRYADFQARSTNREALEQAVTEWVAARPSDEVIAAFRDADAAIARVLTMDEIFADPHYRARQMLTTVGGVTMQNVIANLSRTPGRIRHPGRPFGADTRQVLDRLRRKKGGDEP